MYVSILRIMVVLRRTIVCTVCIHQHEAYISSKY